MSNHRPQMLFIADFSGSEGMPISRENRKHKTRNDFIRRVTIAYPTKINLT
jgi:hypothetical protein